MTYGIEPTHPVFRQYSFAEVARVQLAHASRHFNVFKTPNLSPLGTSIFVVDIGFEPIQFVSKTNILSVILIDQNKKSSNQIK